MLALLPLLLAVPAALPQAQEPEKGFDQKNLQEMVDSILPEVARLRGRKFKHPVPAGVQTPDGFMEYAQGEFEEEGLDKIRALGVAYGLLGLMEPGRDLHKTISDLLRGQVGGYYDPKTKKFYMISTFNKGIMAEIIMSHELTHALDDQYYDLQKMVDKVKDDSDREFAVRAVVEGSGTSLMSLYAIKVLPARMGSMGAEEAAEMQKMMAEQTESLADVPPYLVITLALPYLEGNKFLVRNSSTLKAMSMVPSNDDLDRAFRHPPLSSEQILHFEKYWDPARRDDPTTVRLPDLSKELGDGWEMATSDTLGELGAFFLTADSIPDMASAAGQISGVFTNKASSGWDGDLFQLYRGPDDAALVVWASVWDTRKDRDEFAKALLRQGSERLPALVEVRQGDDGVVAFFASARDAALEPKLREALFRARPDWKE